MILNLMSLDEQDQLFLSTNYLSYIILPFEPCSVFPVPVYSYLSWAFIFSIFLFPVPSPTHQRKSVRTAGLPSEHGVLAAHWQAEAHHLDCCHERDLVCRAAQSFQTLQEIKWDEAFCSLYIIIRPIGTGKVTWPLRAADRIARSLKNCGKKITVNLMNNYINSV
jgi:hypothetical protein